MVRLRRRLERLEGPRGPRRCPSCAGKIILREYLEDGTAVYPHGEPCEECGSRPPDGSIVIIEVCPPGRGEAGDASFL